MNTAIGIFGIAYDHNFKRFDGFGVHPQFRNFIESVFPANVETLDPNTHFIKVDTTNTDSVVIAAPRVVLPGGEVREFSFFLVDSDGNGMIEKWDCHILPVHKGEFGIVGLYYGVPALAPIHRLEPRLLNIELFADKIISHLRGTEVKEKDFEFAVK